MAKDKRRENAEMLDPNRFKMAQSMSVVPGGPMNNNPQNVVNVGNNPGSMSGVNQYPYGDSGLANDPRLGSNGVYPQPNTGQPQTFPSGRGYNGQPFGTQQQPPAQAEEMLEGARLGMQAQQKGLNTSQFMGMIGQPAQPAPGGSVPSPQQTPMTMPLQGMQSAEQAPSQGKGMNMKSGKRG